MRVILPINAALLLYFGFPLSFNGATGSSSPAQLAFVEEPRRISSPESASSQLLWHPTRPLNWTDFQGMPDPGEGVDALSSCGISLDPTLTKTGELRFEVDAYFSRPDSWVDGADASSLLLHHEQGHFDIGEIYARKLRRRLANTRFERGTLNQQITALYQQTFDEYAKAQETYDRVAEHSTNPAGQLEWDRWIARELQRNEAYRGRLVRGIWAR
jgi:hypothetical protein